MSAYADWFRKTRNQKGQTQLQAAELLRLTGPTVSRWESGGLPDARHLWRVVRWGKISSDKLLRMLDSTAARN